MNSIKEHIEKQKSFNPIFSVYFSSSKLWKYVWIFGLFVFPVFPLFFGYLFYFGGWEILFSGSTLDKTVFREYSAVPLIIFSCSFLLTAYLYFIKMLGIVLKKYKK